MKVINILLNIKQANSLVLLYLLLFFSSCAPKSHLASTAFKYHISGRIEGSQDGDTVLLGVVGSSKRINTAIIKNSKFRFKGIVPELSMGVIQYKYSFNITDEAAFVIEKAPIKIEAHLKPDDKDYTIGKIVKAGKQNQYLQELKTLQKPFYNIISETTSRLQQAQRTNNLKEAEFAGKLNKEAQENIRISREKFIIEHPNAIAALYNYYNSLDYKFQGLEKALTTLNLFDDQIKKTSLWKKIKDLAEQEAASSKL